MSLQQTLRWFGPDDPVSLAEIRQAGASGVVTSLHHIPIGDVWPVDEIEKRQDEIETAGLTWSVVESLPVHEDIKLSIDNCETYIQNYIKSLHNLSSCGIKHVCYNFMPILDWTRTDLNYVLDDGSSALRYDMKAFAAFDLFILKRPNSVNEYDANTINLAKEYYDSLDEAEVHYLKKCILMGLPGGNDEFTIEELLIAVNRYNGVDDKLLRKNLQSFLKRIVPVAEEADILLGIHPDDPPHSLLGLPRIVSNTKDLEQVISAYDSPSNGITFCTGSLAVNAGNDLPLMVRQLGHRINFVHLRSITRDGNGNFYEANHLEGHGNLFNVILELVNLERRRKEEGRSDYIIPMRPDHGHLLYGDRNKKSNPGYSGIGRLKGLAEIRGLEYGIRHMGSKAVVG